MAKGRSYQDESGQPSPLPPGCLPIGMQRERAAGYLRLTLDAFDKLDRSGDLPRPKSIDGLRVWDRRALEGFWIEQTSSLEPRCPTALVYVVGIPGFVKIGFTTRSVASRVAGLQTGCPHLIEVLELIPGTRATEAHLHMRFNDYRAAGEWFRNEGAVAEWIEGGCKL